jgi:protein crumbs
MYYGVNYELEIDDYRSQLCLHGCFGGLLLYLESVKTTVNSALINIPVSYIFMEISCADGGNNDHCICTVSEFTETNFETLMPICWSKPCHNDTTCEDTVNSYICHCFPWYTGTLCDMDINEHSSHPCQLVVRGVLTGSIGHIAGLPSSTTASLRLCFYLSARIHREEPSITVLWETPARCWPKQILRTTAKH